MNQKPIIGSTFHNWAADPRDMARYERIQMKQMMDRELTAAFIKHQGHEQTVIKM